MLEASTRALSVLYLWVRQTTQHSRACGGHARALLLGLTTGPKLRRSEGAVPPGLCLKTCPKTASDGSNMHGDKTLKEFGVHLQC